MTLRSGWARPHARWQTSRRPPRLATLSTSVLAGQSDFSRVSLCPRDRRYGRRALDVDLRHEATAHWWTG